MKFVALLSGGKDSVYCIDKCLQEGHELLCVANLYPPPDPQRLGDELNSYMYQSAAFTAIPQQAECLGVPLIRREITGCAKLQTLNYQETSHDETEDLFALLEDVKAKFPDVIGVSCGTIISNYQRFRVENTCQRLGLTPLSYLWQRDRGELLKEMLDSGLEAVLVKTAGAGLVPDKHLGKTLNQLYPTLLRLHERFELDLCGEGGEYETLVLNSRVFKKSLELTETTIDYDAEDESVGWLRVITCESRFKNETLKEGCEDNKDFENAFIEDQEAESRFVQIEPFLSPQRFSSRTSSCTFSPHLYIGQDGFCQTGLLYPPLRNKELCSPQEQLRVVLHGLSLSLSERGSSVLDSVFVHLYVSDMNRFQEVNEEYQKWFGVNPPSRSCIQCNLPSGTMVAVECVVLVGSNEKNFLGVKNAKKEVLHVRSVSSWAPVCIGPYAQANVVVDSVIFIAGQIALVPASMKMLSDTDDAPVPWHSEIVISLLRNTTQLPPYRKLMSCMLKELFLSLFHVNRVMSALAGNIPSHPLSSSSTIMVLIYVDVKSCAEKYFSYMSSSETHDALTFEEVVEEVHALLTSLKHYANYYISNYVINMSVSAKKLSEEYDDGECDSDDGRSNDTKFPIPILMLGVDALPREALVEVEFVGATSRLQTCPQKSITSAAPIAKIAPISFFETYSEVTAFTETLCGGTFSIASISSSQHLNSHLLADVVADHIRNIMNAAGLRVDMLRIVKLFVAEMCFQLLTDIKTSLVRALGKTLGLFNLDPVVLPVTFLEKNYVISVQYIFLDTNILLENLQSQCEI